MRYVTLDQVVPGMILAKEVRDSSDRILIGQQCELNHNYIDKLKELGFGGLYIEDALSEGIELEDIISEELRSASIKSVQECDVEQCQDIAKQIVDEILSNGVNTFEMINIKSFDDYLYKHSVNVAVLSCLIGVGLGFNVKSLEHLCQAGLLHDFGKTSIPPEILNKPGTLTPEEYQLIKLHAVASYEFIKERWDVSAHVKLAVLHHHENEDGSGYPDMQNSDEIHMLAKVLHVADVYDALVSRRSYKKAFSPSEAVEYMMAGSGKLFDPNILQSFLQYVPLYPKGTLVTLSNGQEGIVYLNHKEHMSRPTIKLLDGTLISLADKQHYNLTILTTDDIEDIIRNEMERQKMIRGTFINTSQKQRAQS